MKRIFKTLFSLLVVLGLVSVAIACDKTQEQSAEPADDNTSYHVVGGHLNDWSNYTDANKMTKISAEDLGALKSKLLDKEITAVLKLEGREFNADFAWTTPAYVNEKSVSLDGGYTVKVVYAEYDAADDTTFAKQWCPDPKTACVQNLTPESLFIPKWVETPAEGEEHLGKWDQNPVITSGAGEYTIYFVEYAGVNTADSPKYAMAAVKTKEVAENIRKEFDVLGSLNTADTDVYTLEVKDGTATIAATKAEGKEWANVNAPVYDVAHMKSLRFTISGDCVAKLKVESSVGGKEVDLELSATPTAYEWDLSGAEEQAILAGENVKFVLFALPGEKEGEGNVTLSNVKFAIDKAMFNPIKSGYNNFPKEEIPADANIYDGTSETFDVNKKWAGFDKDTYTITYGNDGEANVAYKVGGWQHMFSRFYGDYSKFEYVTVVVTGEANVKLLVKAQDLFYGGAGASEERFVMNGEQQTFSLKLSEAVRALRYQVLLFATDGAGGEGNFTVHACYLSNEDETDLGRAPVQKLTYDGYNTKDYDLNRNWYSPDENYEIKNDKSPWEVSYKKDAEHTWSSLALALEGQWGNFNKVSIGLEFAEGVKYLVKVQSADNKVAVEKEVLGTGQCAETVLDLSKLTVAERDSLAALYIFAQPGDAAEGTFKVHWAKFDGFLYRGIGAVVYTGEGSNVGVAEPTLWHDNGDKVYTIQKASDAGKEGSIYVTYTKGAGHHYSAMRIYVLGNLGDWKTLNGGIELAAGKTAIIKVEGNGVNKEMTFEGDGACKAFNFDLSALTKEQRNKITSVVIMVEGGSENVSGDFAIHWMQFTDRQKLEYDGAETNSFDVNREWYSGDAGVFKLVNTASPWEFSYTRNASQNWSSLKVDLSGNFAGFAKLAFGIEFAEGVKYIVKIAGNGWDAEYKGVGTGAYAGGEIDLTGKTAEQLATVNQILIFVDYENEAAHTGSFKIHWMGINK